MIGGGKAEVKKGGQEEPHNVIPTMIHTLQRRHGTVHMSLTFLLFR